ncbi:hypothetical protein [Thiohalocapsa marina]|uniref:hypothetical protein n=1 Tax=Thiohalocapsa marina TaxID=424902 RepID=UPI0036DC2EFA
MATLTYPNITLAANRHFAPDQFEAELRPNVLMSTSVLTGAIQTVQVPGTRWIFRLTYGVASAAEQAEREAFFAELEGMVNRVALYHTARPTPRGTRQTNTTLSASAAVGATTLAMTATTGQTLLRGDMVGVGGQLFQVVADATAASSVLTVSVRPAVRTPLANGAAVTLVRPTANFMLASAGVSVPYEGPTGGSFLAEFAQVLT